MGEFIGTPSQEPPGRGSETGSPHDDALQAASSSFVSTIFPSFTS
jgi:hypothetical protein